eukprot:366093-Chlamydomonas_euryale.AAC.7
MQASMHACCKHPYKHRSWGTEICSRQPAMHAACEREAKHEKNAACKMHCPDLGSACLQEGFGPIKFITCRTPRHSIPNVNVQGGRKPGLRVLRYAGARLPTLPVQHHARSLQAILAAFKPVCPHNLCKLPGVDC